MILDHGIIFHKYLGKIYFYGFYLFKMINLWREKDGVGWREMEDSLSIVIKCMIFKGDLYCNYIQNVKICIIDLKYIL